jgi:CubicO group peptidase (beta-lactamase class C family)
VGPPTIQDLLPSTPPHGGIVQLAVHERDTIVDRAIGRAGTGQPVRTDSIFYVGSIAKQFTAACIALLERDGKLDLDAPPTEWVDGLRSWAERITVRQLVHHTAGVRERSRTGPGVPTDGVPAWGNAELLDHLRQVEDLDFEPGTRYGYSNRGYLLLAEVIAVASGSSLADMAHERIFEPLGMADTLFRDAPTPLPEPAARGHFRGADGQIRVEPARFHAVGAGGLWTTAADLARWDANFDDDRLTGGWLPERLTTRGTLSDGTPIHYAWGLSIRTHRGLPIASHGGNFPGWEAKMVRFPTERATVIVLANAEELGVSSMALDLADRMLTDRIDPGAPHADDTFDF